MLKIVFTSEDNENSMFGIEEFPISAEHASQLMRGDMCIERFLDDMLQMISLDSKAYYLRVIQLTMLQWPSNLNQVLTSKRQFKNI